jgi:hypothetical protein
MIQKMTDKEPRTRADCVADISIYASNLAQIAKCAYDAIREKDIPTIVDCMNKFYTGYGAISGAILSYNGTITEDEVMKYLTSIMEIEKEFKKTTTTLAKKLK